jgi:hypothetical protein
MRNEFLRDAIAGSAGVLLVMAVIGLPNHPAATAPQGPAPWQGVRLLPYYSPDVHSQVPAPQFRAPGSAHLTP